MGMLSVASSKVKRNIFQRDMQITLNRRASARSLITSRAEDALIKGTISSTVPAPPHDTRSPTLSQRWCTMYHRVISNAAPYVRAVTARARAYATLSRSARCASHCVAMVKQMRRSSSKNCIRELQSLTYLCRGCARWRNNIVEVYARSTGFVHSQLICIQRFLLIRINWLKNN